MADEKRIDDLLEANNRYLEAWRSERRRADQLEAAVAGYDKVAEKAAEELRKANAAANESGHIIHLVKQELKSTGHQHEGKSLDILVDIAIDTERERHSANLAAIANTLGFSHDSTTKAPGFVAKDIIDEINRRRSASLLICEALGVQGKPLSIGHALDMVLAKIAELHRRAGAAEARPTAGMADETVARNAEMDAMQKMMGEIVAKVHLLERRVEQLMARADNEDNGPRDGNGDPLFG